MPKNFISISTKTGDQGTSGLANGQRLDKTDPTFMLLGDLDELNSWLGLSVAKLKQWQLTLPKKSEERVKLKLELKLFELIQDWIYQASALVARAPKFKLSLNLLKKIEKSVDQLQTDLAPDWHKQFLYPGGSELGGWLDITRSVARRTERSFLTWQVQDEFYKGAANHLTPQNIQITLNRLSDYLYLLRCWCNAAQLITEKKFVTHA